MWNEDPLKILALDIETSPNIADVWGLFNQNVGLNQLRESTRMICFVAKFLDEDEIHFYSEFHHGRDEMVQAAHGLLSEADVLLHYNGDSFDIKHLNREFATAGMTPPAPYKSIDLLKVVKRRFKFPSNKLAYVSQAFGLDGKEETGGHNLWVRCMAGDPEAWETMRQYNERDVILLEELYEKLLPWIPNHPNRALYSGNPEDACTNCGSTDLRREGHRYTATGKFQRFVCRACGTWLTSGKRVEAVDIRQAG